MEDIDKEIRSLQNQINILISKKRDMLKSKTQDFREKYPVVYVIHENARGHRGIVNYMDFQRNHGCYTTREKAEEVLKEHFQHIRLSHHDTSFRVKAEASEELSDNELLMLDRKTYYPPSP